MTEMTGLIEQGKDCWLGRVQKIEELLNMSATRTGKSIGRHLKGRFDSFWLRQIREEKPGPDGLNHNKLRTYSKFKGFFGTEPYLSAVTNRNQRANLTRLRTSAHCLGVELLRYSKPKIPLADRGCRFCGPLGPRVAIGNPGRGPVDDEEHAITVCNFMAAERVQLYKSITHICPVFVTLSNESKFVKLMCPVSSVECNLISRFIKSTFDKRNISDEGRVG